MIDDFLMKKKTRMKKDETQFRSLQQERTDGGICRTSSISNQLSSLQKISERLQVDRNSLCVTPIITAYLLVGMVAHISTGSAYSTFTLWFTRNSEETLIPLLQMKFLRVRMREFEKNSKCEIIPEDWHVLGSANC